MKTPRTFCLILWLAAVPLSAAADASPLQLTLPPAWYGVPGVTNSLYYDNIVLTEQPESYRFQVTCDIGRSEERRWTVTPTDAHVGVHELKVSVLDAGGKILESASTVLRIVPRNAGVQGRLRLLIVGDSLTAATHYPNEIARLLSAPGNPQWTMLGTCKPAGAAPGVCHEGYGGWTWSAFLTRYNPALDHKLDEKGKRQSSPFVFAGADGKLALDIPRYLREHCNGQPPDVATFLLGINDCFGAKPDDPAAMDRTVDIALDNAEKFLKSLRAAAPKTAFAIGLTTPPNARESGFEANYKGRYHRWGWKRIQHRLVQRMIKQFAGREGAGIYVVPTELNLDPVDGYPDNNGVHPNTVGYRQIGASFYCWLKWWLSEKRP
jgi:lysophospholipase L1-like esterase